MKNLNAIVIDPDSGFIKYATVGVKKCKIYPEQKTQQVACRNKS
jgi:hypothetical protein